MRAKMSSVGYRREHPPQIVKESIKRITTKSTEIENVKQAQEDINSIAYDEFMNSVFKTPNKKTTEPRKIPKDICPVCQKNTVQSKHHIIPRKYTENNDKINLIWLCNSCHDEIELKTEDWIESGKLYSSGILRRMIIKKGF